MALVDDVISLKEHNLDELKTNLKSNKTKRKLSENSECDFSYENCENNKNEEILMHSISDASFEIKDRNSQQNFKSIMENLEKGIEMKKHANLLFKNQDFEKAYKNFKIEDEKVVEMLALSSIEGVRIECLHNISICSYLLKDYQEIIKYTNEILQFNPNDYKALYLRVKSLIKLDRNQEALIFLKKTLCIKPTKALFGYLKSLELKLSNVDQSSMEENENSAKSKSTDIKEESHTGNTEKNTPPTKNSKDEKTNFLSSKLFLVKLIRIIFNKIYHSLRKNKLLFTIIVIFLALYYKQDLSKMYEKVLGVVRF